MIGSRVECASETRASTVSRIFGEGRARWARGAAAWVVVALTLLYSTVAHAQVPDFEANWSRARANRSEAAAQLQAALDRVRAQNAEYEARERDARQAEESRRQFQRAFEDAQGDTLGAFNACREAEAEPRRLQAEWERVLADLRGGYYCSQCNRSRTEIEAGGGETFEQHLVSVNGHPVPAPEELVEARRRDFASRIAAAQQRVDGFRARIAAAQQRQSDAEQRLQLARNREADAFGARNAALARRNRLRDDIYPYWEAWLGRVGDEGRARNEALDSAEATLRQRVTLLDETHTELERGVTWRMFPREEAESLERSVQEARDALEALLARDREEDRRWVDQANAEAAQYWSQADSFHLMLLPSDAGVSVRTPGASAGAHPRIDANASLIRLRNRIDAMVFHAPYLYSRRYSADRRYQWVRNCIEQTTNVGCTRSMITIGPNGEIRVE